MALKTLSNSGIANGSPILPGQVTQSVDAFTGAEGYAITISGSFTFSGATTGSGWFQNSISSSRAVSSSAAISSSYALSSSFSDNSNTALNATNATYATLINNNNQPDVALSGSNGNFINGNLGLLAGSVTLNAGTSPVMNPSTLTGKQFQTEFWVTATKASGSTVPSAPVSFLYVSSPGLGSFQINEVGKASNDDVNFVIVYK
jgi:hypothetical protein